jgi:hypothetical protein
VKRRIGGGGGGGGGGGFGVNNEDLSLLKLELWYTWGRGMCSVTFPED